MVASTDIWPDLKNTPFYSTPALLLPSYPPDFSFLHVFFNAVLLILWRFHHTFFNRLQQKVLGATGAHLQVALLNTRTFNLQPSILSREQSWLDPQNPGKQLLQKYHEALRRRQWPKNPLTLMIMPLKELLTMMSSSSLDPTTRF
jgi:hypothetical protein